MWKRNNQKSWSKKHRQQRTTRSASGMFLGIVGNREVYWGRYFMYGDIYIRALVHWPRSLKALLKKMFQSQDSQRSSAERYNSKFCREHSIESVSAFILFSMFLLMRGRNPEDSELCSPIIFIVFWEVHWRAPALMGDSLRCRMPTHWLAFTDSGDCMESCCKRQLVITTAREDM